MKIDSYSSAKEVLPFADFSFSGHYKISAENFCFQLMACDKKNTADDPPCCSCRFFEMLSKRSIGIPGLVSQGFDIVIYSRHSRLDLDPWLQLHLVDLKDHSIDSTSKRPSSIGIIV